MKASYDGRTIVPIANFDSIYNRARYTMDSKSFAIISGENGYGKTTGLLYIESQLAGVKYFRIGVGETGKSFYARFLTELSTDEDFDPKELERRSYLHLLLERATWIINKRKDIKLIVIDEFGNHNARFIPYLRQIWDNINETAGLLLAGPPSALADMRKWQAEGKRGINEILSRVGNRITELEKNKPSDIEMICNSRGIHEAFEVNYFYQNADDLRALHMLIDDYKNGILKIR